MGLLGRSIEFGWRLRYRASVRIKTGYPTNAYRRVVAANQKTNCMELLLTAFFIQSAFKNDVHRVMTLKLGANCLYPLLGRAFVLWI